MGVPYTLYRTDTGEILATGDCSDEQQCQLQLRDPENENIYLGMKADDATQWVTEGGKIAARPALDVPEAASIAADGLAEIACALPAGTVVSFNGATAISDGDGFGFTTDIPGTYVFAFAPPFPFIPHTLTIEATYAV